MSGSLVEILLAAQRCLATHRATPQGTCLACKGTGAHPCEPHRVAERVAELIRESIAAPRKPPADPVLPRNRARGRYESPWGHEAPRSP